MTQVNFKDLREVKKGELGEKIVDEYLISNGLIPYAPCSDGAHPFDRLCATSDKKIFIAECKSKRSRDYYPDTGIEYRHYLQYIKTQKRHNLDIMLFFVDEKAEKIYGNHLNKLAEPFVVSHNGMDIKYPWKHGGQIYFPLAKMKDVAPLNEDAINRLKELTHHQPGYAGV